MMIIIILIISLITHLFLFGYPASVVFDEVHNGKFLINYWQGNYLFDVHPPLGRLIETFFGYIIGVDNYTFDYTKIGNTLPDPIILLRLAPIIAGILLPVVVYLILKNLNFSKLASFTGAMLICLENSLIVQSRFILYDIFILIVGFLAILCYLEYNKQTNSSPKKTILIFASLLFAASAPTIKWTGLAFPFLIILMELHRLISNNVKGKILIKKIVQFSGIYFLAILILYTSIFAIHFKMLPYSGTGDAFMSERFNSTLINNPAYGKPGIKPKNFIEKTIETNLEMLNSNKRMTATHPYSSKWYTWPIMQRSIFYWQDNAPTKSDTRSYIYLLGNPFVYWLGTLSILSLIIFTIYNLIFKKQISQDPQKNRIIIFIIVGFLANLLPYMLIGRVMFLYHYETALIFSIFAIVFWIDMIKDKKKIYAIILVLVIALSTFMYFSPLTYGTPITDKQLKNRMWLPSWR